MRFGEFSLSEATIDAGLKKIQQFLISKGYDLGPTKDDGIWGPYTSAAISAFKQNKPPSQARVQPPNSPAAPKNQPPSSAGKVASTKLPSGDLMPTNGRISGHYGRTVTGPKGTPVKHPGVDIAAPEGTPIIAPADGRVTFAGWANTAGNLVELITQDGHKHRFMHMSKIVATNGSQVKAGATLGMVGNTGYSRGNHLHWEKYAGTRQLNPLAE